MRSNRPLLIAVLAVLLTGLLFAYSYWSTMRQRAAELEAPGEPLAIATEIGEPESEQQPIKLLVYSSTSRNPGRPVERKVEVELATSSDLASKAHQIVNAALHELSSVVPAGAVRQVYLLENGLAVVDFSREVSGQVRGGIAAEYALLLTLTRSLKNNLEEVDRVRFLVGGLEQPTLAGHISLATPFR